MPVKKSLFDPSGTVNRYEISHRKSRLTISVIEYGATIVSVMFPNAGSVQRDLVLGFDDLTGYKSAVNPYFGSTVGRVANRISRAQFQLNGETYRLYRNDGNHHLHGGLVGFDKRPWRLFDESENSVTLKYMSNHGEEGFPGSLEITVRFSVTEQDEIRIEYSGQLLNERQLSTIINLTNHSYFNLSGVQDQMTATIFDHRMVMDAQEYLEVDEQLIPTGKLLSVMQTPLDFTREQTIGQQNYDHCMVLENDPAKWKHQEQGREMKRGATVWSPKTKIKMTFFTDEPGFQFYTGGGLPHRCLKPKRTQCSDVWLEPGSGFCLEAQRFPNAVNQPGWSDQVVLRPGQRYTQTTVYKFENME